NHLRNILLIINPYGGSKKAEKIYRTVVEPILKLSDSNVQTIYTDRSGHAVQIGKEFDAEKFDVVGCVSGDGTVHELINGIGLRKDATRVFKKISISCIPAGSGNALSVNQMGPENGKNPVLATLTLLKGKPLPLDLCSVTQLSQDNQTVERSLSFLSTAFGLMADLDIGTERLRWMGDTRFLLGYIWGALKNQKRSVRLEVQVLDEQKESIHQNWKNFRDQKSDSDGNDVCNNEVGQSGMEKEDEGEGLPELVFGDVLRPVSKGWKTIETDVTSIYAGTLPFMSCDLLEFPVKVQGDGSIDVIIHRSPNWIRTMKCVIGSHVGSMFRNEDCDYLKTRAFRLTPLRKDSTGLTSDIPGQDGKSYIVVDGEEMEYRTLQVEIHNRLARVLSLDCQKLGSIGVPDSIM
ncbi:ATP-NAD kinase-like domain-containing protein, partial [Phakopsora pachyrhizi]